MAQPESPEYHDDRPAFSGKPREHTQVPPFIVKDVYTTPVGDSPAVKLVAEVQCGRRQCGKITIVVVRDWWASDGHNNAACTYCFKAGRKPARPKRRAS